MSHPLKRLAGQTAIYGLSSIVGRLLNYFLVPLYTRVFLPAEYGVVSEMYAYVGLLFVLLTYGMETAFFRFAQDSKDSGKTFTTTLLPLLFTSSAFVLIVSVFSQQIAELINYSQHPEYIWWFGLILGIDAFTAVPFARLRQQNKALKFAAFKLINIGVNIGFNLFFILLCPYWLKNNPDSIVQWVYSAEIGVGYVFISNLIASVVTLLLFIPGFLRLRWQFDRLELKAMLVYALPLLISGMAGMMNQMLDRILLKFWVVPPAGIANSADYIMAQIGIYGANAKIAVLMMLFIQTFRYAAEPFFFSQAKEKDAKKLYAGVMKYFVISGLAIFLGITLFLDIVKHFIGSKYHEGLQVVPVLLIAYLFLGIVFNLSIWYKLNNLTRYGAYITLWGALVTVGLNILLIPQFGYMGAAYAALACFGSMAVLSYFLGRKFYPVPYPLGQIGFYFIFALSIFFIHNQIEFSNEILMYSLRIVFFLIFVSYAGFKEKLIQRILKFKILKK